MPQMPWKNNPVFPVSFIAGALGWAPFFFGKEGDASFLSPWFVEALRG